MQNKFGLKKYDFQKQYFLSLPQNKPINYYENLLSFYSDYSDFNNNQQSIKERYDKYIESLKHIPIDIIQKIISESIIEGFQSYIPTIKTPIDIYSPLFNQFMSNKSLISHLSIQIPLNIIITNNLEQIFNDKFKEINQSDELNYESINIIFKESNDLNELNNINILYKKIKYLAFKYKGDEKNIIPLNLNLLNNIDIQKNCISLDLSMRNILIEPNSLEIINNFNSMKYIRFYEVNFTKIFNINIQNLEYLNLYDCQNICLYSCDNTSKIKELIIKRTDLKNNNDSKFKFPFLIEMKYDNETHLNNIIEYNNLSNLKILKSSLYSFLKINDSPLENIHINSYKDNDIIQIFNQLIKIKTIKTSFIHLDFLENNLIEKIKGNNNNLISLKIEIYNLMKEFTFDNLIKIFPNLSEFGILSYWYEKEKNLELNSNLIKIEENKNSKINKLYVSLYNYNIGKIILNINSFSNLIQLKLGNFKIYEELFPLFNKKCNIIFYSLKTLDISSKFLLLNLFENLINNLDKCPRLHKLNISKAMLKITEQEYFNYIQKVITFKSIEEIELQIFGNTTFARSYSHDEIEKITKQILDKKKFYFFEKYTHKLKDMDDLFIY